MISGKDVYDILSAIVPLYVVMILAYGAVRWWKIFAPDHCAGINHFVAMFSIPLLLFDFIANNNPYAMNHKFIVADSLQKVVTLLFLLMCFTFSKNVSLDCVITSFSVVTLPNTLLIGVPLLEAMYGEYTGKLMVQIVFLQCLVWYNVVLILFECRGAMILISNNFPNNAGSISSFGVDTEVNSLNGNDDVEVDAETTDDGKICVNVRRSFGSKSINSFMSRNSNSVEIYGERSFRDTMPLGSSNKDIHMFEWSDAGEAFQSGQKIIIGANADLKEMEEASFDGTGKRGQGEDTTESVGDVEEGGNGGKDMNNGMPSVGVLTKLILVMVWRRMIRIPNTYATVLGLIWSLLAFRFGFTMPKIMSRSISILSTTGQGSAMFSLGLFLASQTKLISCGKRVAMYTMLGRFLVGPAVAAATAAAIGIRGDLLRISIVQAALPSAIISFVFAKEYNVHADIISTSISIGMVVALPVTILYYVLMGGV